MYGKTVIFASRDRSDHIKFRPVYSVHFFSLPLGPCGSLVSDLPYLLNLVKFSENSQKSTSNTHLENILSGGSCTAEVEFEFTA